MPFDGVEVEDLEAENGRMRVALKAVLEWWLSEGMKHFNGAPYAIFAVRAALADEQKLDT